MTAAPKVRTLHLLRPHPHGPRGPGFGFSVRGGLEHGAGFFVSHVEPGSEAALHGLRVGDQIVRINGLSVERAVHHEVVQMVQGLSRLALRVRGVGMLPVKGKSNDTLSWRILDGHASQQVGSGTKSSKDMPRDVRLTINIDPQTKLGCGICKGPDWKPGIFVQFTKENGLARVMGLRPGDQIVECNGVSFADIPFPEAVNLLKSSRQLDLRVSKAAGHDLFPGESSGYNSSASSVNGDQSPNWEDGKRLSVVKEEAMEPEDRLSHSHSPDGIDLQWEAANGDHPHPQAGNSCTVIRVGEDGHLECSADTNTTPTEPPPPAPTLASGTKLADICMISQQQETTMVVVEVHCSEDTVQEEEMTVTSPRPPPPQGLPQLIKSSSESSCSSLSSAISQELRRRSQRRECDGARRNEEGEEEEDKRRKLPLKPINDEKRQQHEQLMEEFKKAHRRMFAGADGVVEERPTPRQAEHRTAVKEQVLWLDRDGDRETPSSRPGTAKFPPPPPPPPSENLDATSWSSKLSIPGKTSSASSLSSGKSSPYGHIPACPTPDYDTSSLASSSSSGKSGTKSPGMAAVGGKVSLNGTSPSAAAHSKGADKVEMESLESFDLNNPTGPQPKPPATYFDPIHSGKTTPSPKNTVKKPRPVSVTIGEYPTGTDRKPPTRFDFLTARLSTNGHSEDAADAPVSSRLQAELTQTLSRSNLRKRTEPQESLTNGNTGRGPAMGTVTISVNTESGLGARQYRPISLPFHSRRQDNAKPSIHSTAERLGGALMAGTNRVTIRVSNPGPAGAGADQP